MASRQLSRFVGIFISGTVQKINSINDLETPILRTIVLICV
jgi:hypothetical protein